MTTSSLHNDPPAGNTSDSMETAFRSPYLVTRAILDSVRAEWRTSSAKLALAAPIPTELISPPAAPEPRVRIKTLQSWVGLVESVGDETFVARITDEMNLANPIEEVELPVEEVSASDRGLLQAGATFYWSIGYETSRDGQLKRVSAIRFARQPNMSAFEEARVLGEAEALAAVLQGD